MPKKQTKKLKQIKIKTAQPKKPRRPKPKEFMEIMGRLDLIDQEMKKEEELFDIKIKSLELEKQYLWNIVKPGK